MNDVKLFEALFSIISPDEKRPELKGVYHCDGYLIAASQYILAKVHFEDYDFDFEGQIIGPDGSSIPMKFPLTKHLLKDVISEMHELRDEYANAITVANRNLPKGSRKDNDRVLLEVEEEKLHTFELAKLFEVFGVLGETPSLFFGKTRNPVLLKSPSCTAFIMPDYSELAPEDLLFTVDQALRIDLPKLLFNAYKVPQ